MTDDSLTGLLAKCRREVMALRRALNVAKVRILLLHGALAHAIHRTHEHNPRGCSGCEQAQQVLDGGGKS